MDVINAVYATQTAFRAEDETIENVFLYNT
jgi:hypothetical protein